MSSTTLLSANELLQLRGVASLGFENAAKGLSEMVDKEIKVVSPSLRAVPISAVPNLIGQPDDVVVAMYLQVSGDVTAHIMLLLSLEASDQLIRMLMGSRTGHGSVMDDIEQSAMGEVANITGCFFLSALANATKLLMQPSPPAVIVDMAGAALNVPLAPLAMSTDDVLIIDTWFLDDERRIKSLFLMLPSADSLRSIVDRLA